MKKPKNSRKPGDEGEYNFWQPATDMMTGLVFILMLLVALLGLYLLNTYSGYREGDVPKQETEAEQQADGRGWTETEGQRESNDHDSNGGGGSEAESETHETETETETRQTETEPSGGRGYGYGDDEGLKSAVLAELIDGETRRLIPIAGIPFELYRQNGGLQILNTYYPEKISYREYETTENGTFYLPEKILRGTYYFRGLAAPEGYDEPDDQYFTIDRLYDWSDPCTVMIPVYPSKNKIYVQLQDKADSTPLSEGSFKVVAAEDVTTLDGTIRYGKGEVVDEITCDENGYGESKELYLGSYVLKQEDVPEFYAGMKSDLKVNVEKKSDTDPDIQEIVLTKTQIQVTLADELYPTQVLEGAAFTVFSDTDPENAQTVYTDSEGSILLTDLEKNTTYHIQEIQTAENYQTDDTDYTVEIGKDGRIDGETETTLTLTNRILRLSVRVVDTVLRSDTSDVSAELYTSGGTLVESWTTGGTGKSFEGLSEGSYYMVLGEDQEKKYEFQISDTADIQNFEVSVFTWKSAAAAAGGAAGLILVVWLLARLWKWRKKHRKQKQDSEPKGE